jgi:hypothetical protein
MADVTGTIAQSTVKPTQVMSGLEGFTATNPLGRMVGQARKRMQDRRDSRKAKLWQDMRAGGIAGSGSR